MSQDESLSQYQNELKKIEISLKKIASYEHYEHETSSKKSTLRNLCDPFEEELLFFEKENNAINERNGRKFVA